MEKLKHMKDCLMACVQNQVSGHLDQVDAKELGEAIDMIKDLEEAIYYATITKAMEEKPLQQHGGGQQQQQQYMPMPQYNDGQNYNSGNQSRYMNYNNGSRNYNDPMYNRGSSNGNMGNGRSYMHDTDYGAMGMSQYERDAREGTSPMYRKMYMEAKETHQDKATQMRELEAYMQELTSDIVEMVEDASPEEKQYLSKRISTLATKISN